MSDVNIEASVMKVDAGDLTASGNLFLEKVSHFIELRLLPGQIVRVAKAEAEAAIIRAQSEIKITDLQRRATVRFFKEQAQQQKVIEDVTLKALPLINATADPSQVDDDWLRNFFERVRIITNEEMQALFSRVLAGEANSPGAFSKRTTNLLSELEASDARLFTSLCNFAWSPGPIILNPDDEIYAKHGIDRTGLRHLDSLGLISYKESAFLAIQLAGVLVVEYQGRRLWLGNRSPVPWIAETGTTMFTKAGRELMPVCQLSPIDGFWEYVRARWERAISPEQEPCSPDSVPLDSDSVKLVGLRA